MPLYEYECEACGHRFEKIQKFSDPPVDVCPKCGSRVRKLMASPAIQFKGSGWYITDYAKKDSSATAKTDGETKKDSETKKEGETKKDKDASKTDSSTTTSSSDSSTSSKSSKSTE